MISTLLLRLRCKAALLLAVTVSGLVAGPALQAAQPAAELDQLYEEYFEAYLELDPVLATSIGDPRYNDRYEISISPQWRARAEKLERDYLSRLSKIDVSALESGDRLSYEIFKAARELEIEGFRYPDHLLPLNQFYSTPNFFAQLGSGKSIQPFATVKDYEDFLQRAGRFGAWTDQAIINMRKGMAEGYVQPAVLIERVLPQLQAQIVESPEDSVYWGPIADMPESFSAEDRQRLKVAYRELISGQLVPNYQRMHEFLRTEYLPKCRDSFGMQGLPGGDAWYDYRVRRMTTTNYTPERIHEIGLAEVARIHGEMRDVMKRVGFEGDLQAFFKHLKTDPRFFWKSREELVAGYVAIKQRVDPALPRLFRVLPKADYEVRPVEPFREKSAAGGSYQAASEDGSRPGVFYANAYDLGARPKWAMESLSLHEGNPGHHFQISIQREQQALPRFRRFGRYTAYSEGWALYAESLGPELGMLTDPYQYYGMLEAELWRSIRLVVDTGLHAKGWTRQQVLDYMEANSATGEARRVAEAERYMAIPGQALAYKIGQLKIRELRTDAEKSLGSDFDVRAFHDEVLVSGALPLHALEAKLDRWMIAKAE